MAHISGSASSDIDAPIGAVWAVVRDVERWAQWQETLGEVTVTQADGHGLVRECQVKIDAKITQIAMTLECSYDEPSQMAFTRIAGDLSSLGGTWQLADIGEHRTRATYTLDVDPGRVIGFLLNAERKERLRGQLVDARPGELKAAVESAGV